MRSEPDHLFGKWLSNPNSGEEVVVTGVSGRLPESNSVYEFAENLFNKKDLITDDDRRWALRHHEIPKRGARVKDIDKFDAGFYGMHHRQVEHLCSMASKFLEVAIESIIDSGVNPSELEGSRTGVYVGACFSDAEHGSLVSLSQPHTFSGTGYLRSFISHRLSYYLKLKGSSCIVDTACSSSMNALELAVREIRTGRCDSALVGGTSLTLHPGTTLQFFRLGVLSADGVCKVFDEAADGYVRGEAITCVFLQKAKHARRIYGKIIYCKVNDDGFKPEGITFPAAPMQQQLMTEIFDDSGIHPSQLTYLEAHGTGTRVGDPQELAAIDRAIAKPRQRQLLIGSVKCNIGHTEGASGLCSLIKVIIAMETDFIPPNTNFKQPRRDIEAFEQGRLKVITERMELGDDDAIIGINNFGFGGNNCHALVRRFKKTKIPNGIPEDDFPRLVCVSGRSEEAVHALFDNINRKPLNLELVGLFHQIFKANIKGHIYRGFTILSRPGPIHISCNLCLQNPSPLHLFVGPLQSNAITLGRYFLKFPVFKSIISRVDELLGPKNINVYKTIVDSQDDPETNILAAMAVQIGIVEILKLLELDPVMEYEDAWGNLIAAYYYGSITLEDICLQATEVSSPNFCTRETLHFAGENQPMKHNSLNNVAKKKIVVNISDKNYSGHDIRIIYQNNVTFLEALGSLYEQGCNPQIYKLYPEVDYPVSRGTPMISPFIKWNHKKSWKIFKFSECDVTDTLRREFQISLQNPKFKYMKGHNIDGRILVPAMAFLDLVWETLAYSRRLLTQDLPVVFENCKFIKAVTMQENDEVALGVQIQQYTGNYEVLQKDALIASGRVYVKNDNNLGENDSTVKVEKESETLVVEGDDVYRELYLRGYNYSGLFKGLHKCNVEGTKGLLKWDDNWIAFLDSMLHITILHIDTTQLLIPVAINRVSIDPVYHLKITKNLEEPLVPVYASKESNIIRTGGVEISGWRVTPINRKKLFLEPVLEKNEFIANVASLGLGISIRVNTQIVLENTLNHNFKAVELLDEFAASDASYILPLVFETLADIPSVNPDLIVSSKTIREDIPGVKFEEFVLTSESDLTLIIGAKILSRPILPLQILTAVKSNGFILSRESLEFVPQTLDNIEIVAVHTTEKEKIILFRKYVPNATANFMEVSSNHFNWLPELKNALRQKLNVVVYTQGDLEGTLGLVNCIRREPGGDKVKCFFMTGEAPEFDPELEFFKNQMRKNLAFNVHKSSEWGTYRHLLLDELPEVETEHSYLRITSIGDLSSLKWVEGPLTSNSVMDEENILVHSYYCSMNFKDVVLALGRISPFAFTKPGRLPDSLLGMEYSGRDSSGRRVMGMVTFFGQSTLISADVKMLLDVPEQWTLEEAATVPVVYSTLIYALRMIITLKPNMSILIHSGTGGIGLAALNMCLHFGCQIFVTVGNDAKRTYIKEHFPQIPESHIGNSRDTSFEETIRLGTGGRGVDIVVNSLTGKLLKASVRCLARGGHFMEIGKFDLANNESLQLLMVEKGISYHGIMLDQIFLRSPEMTVKLIKELDNGIKTGYVKPLPTIVFAREETETAYRHMTTGKHIGKVLIKLRDEENLKVIVPPQRFFKSTPRFSCDSTKSYVIVGGLGGVGLKLCEWLVLKNAKKLVIATRSEEQSGYQKRRIQILKTYGVALRIINVDVTKIQGCFDLIKQANDLGPVDGVFNLAVVLRDALLEDQTEEAFYTSFAPKSLITRNLDDVTRSFCPHLKYFVVFSSVSCGRGNVGQSNYGMANSIMERICEKRKRDGLPALAIQWGAIGDVGLVAKMQKENKELVIGGTLQQKLSSCLDVLDLFLTQDNPVVSSMVVAEKQISSQGSLSAVHEVARILGIKDIKTISHHVTLSELGLDSIMGSEVIQLLEKDFEIFFTPKELRILTFARLKEIEEEKDKSNVFNKVQSGVNLFIQHLPKGDGSNLPTASYLRQMKTLKGNTKVFLFPGIEGIIESLQPLITQLNANVIGVKYDYYNPKHTVEGTAMSIVPHIEEHLSRSMSRTFNIIAYSFGTIVALEVVSMLEAKGYIGRMIAIDGSPSYLVSVTKNYFVGETEADLEMKILEKIMALFLPLSLFVENKEKLLNCDSFNNRVELALTLVPPDLLEKNQAEKQAIFMLYRHVKNILQFNFAHQKIKSTVHLFRANYPLVDSEDSDYHWSIFCENPVQTMKIDGDHGSMLNDVELATAVNKLIQ